MLRILQVSMVCALAATLPINAAADQEVNRDGVKYVSGGVGADSEARLSARAKEFNLKLLFTLNEGNYVADVGVTVADARGKTVIEHVADGPLFMARLPQGQYRVTASYEGRALTRKVAVGSGLRTEHFRWPSNPAVDLPVSRWREPGDAPKVKAEKVRVSAARPAAEAARGGPVAVVSGGVGEDALAMMKAKEGEYNLKLVFTLNEGNYLADVGVAIKDAAGKTVVEHVADGPIFLAKLPAGTYSASVSYDGKTQARKVRVSERLHTEYFRWAGNPQADFPLQRDQAEEAKPRSRPKRG